MFDRLFDFNLVNGEALKTFCRISLNVPTKLLLVFLNRHVIQNKSLHIVITINTPININLIFLITKKIV